MESKFQQNTINAIHLLEERVAILEKRYNNLQTLNSDILDIKRELEVLK